MKCKRSIIKNNVLLNDEHLGRVDDLLKTEDRKDLHFFEEVIYEMKDKLIT